MKKSKNKLKPLNHRTVDGIFVLMVELTDVSQSDEVEVELIPPKET